MKPVAYRGMKCWYLIRAILRSVRANSNISKFLNFQSAPRGRVLAASRSATSTKRAEVRAHERNAGSKHLSLTIYTYSDFPAVRLVVKQAHIEHDTLLEFEYMLCDT